MHDILMIAIGFAAGVLALAAFSALRLASRRAPAVSPTLAEKERYAHG